MQTEIALRYEERGEFWSGGGLSCSAPFWRAFFERKKKTLFQCSNVPFSSCLYMTV